MYIGNMYFNKVILFMCVSFTLGEVVQIKTNLGRIEGKTLLSRLGREFYSFTGIPYAKPPINSLRFKPPVPIEPWKGVLNAKEIPPVCVQQDIFLKGTHPVQGEEDCLYLNVYMPKLSEGDNKPLPVMFFIHGGGFLCGTGNLYEPHILMDRDVILVTINYRLGAIGFLSTGDEIVPGNNGLKDQNLALKWVYENIAEFGGNPDKITIFGQSAGGASAHYHVLSPLSKGLFTASIAHSGTALGHWALGQNTAKFSRKLGKVLGCPTDCSEKMVKCLQKINPYKIAAQERKFLLWDIEPLIPFRPVVEIDHEGAFLPDYPANIIKNGKSNPVSFMTGLTSDDGAIRSAAILSKLSLAEDLDENFDKIFPIILDYPGHVPDLPDLTKKVRKYYFGDQSINASTKQGLTDLYTDLVFLHPAQQTIELHTTYTNNPVYYYLFGYKGEYSFSNVYAWDGDDYGVCHTDDLLYLFPFNMILPERNINKNDENMIDTLTSLWTNFAATGNPTRDSENFDPWKPVSSKEFEYYDITNRQTKNGLYSDRAKFWKKILTNSKPFAKDEL